MQVLSVLKYIKMMAFFQAEDDLPESADTHAEVHVLMHLVSAVSLQTRLFSG